MEGIEWRGISPEELVREIENSIRNYKENKYAYQVGLKGLDFDVDEDILQASGISLPFTSIDQAEQALRMGVFSPKKLIEDDNTEHQVLLFDHRPVGYSGYMDCVTHSLTLTNLGLFEVGRYPAISLTSQNHYWQWFLHRRLATVEEVNNFCESHDLTSSQFIQEVYQALTAG